MNRYITPEPIIKKRIGVSEIPSFDSAIIIFRDSEKSKKILKEFTCTQSDKKLIYGIDKEYTFFTEINGARLLILTNCVFGAHQAAIIVEELYCFGVKCILGLGACGSISESIKKGDMVFDYKTIISDSTSRQYTSDSTLSVHNELTSIVNEKLSSQLKPVVSGTVDSLYRETDILVNNYRISGIEIINMEAGPFHAVAKACNIQSLWIGCVTDCLHNDNWIDWYDTEKLLHETGRIAQEFLKLYFTKFAVGSLYDKKLHNIPNAGFVPM
jgi:uridine phosphorylase